MMSFSIRHPCAGSSLVPIAVGRSLLSPPAELPERSSRALW
jgi:hypothetical protein